ncbi:SMI1/KNR4 family protein [Streptomyces sp. NPDC089173]|uniref:SMI1/KNR4 family protein n=1 Tax=Streptomyces sp. NPDC089173 TaxID=3154965 RepID=UPI00344DDB2E
MDPRIPRLRRKLAAIPLQPLRSRSFGEEHHMFRSGPKLPGARVAAIEAERGIVLPDAFRQFVMYVGGSGAAPFYGLFPLVRCRLLVMEPLGEPGAPRGFERADGTPGPNDLFLHIIEMGCTDVCVLALTGPLTGRVLTGNSDGHWGPDTSPATDFLDWYESWLDGMSDRRTDRALELTSPGSPPPYPAITVRAR